jgi:hypothetical protein
MLYLDDEYMAAFRKARPSVPAVLKWIEALRSGKYSQLRGGLCRDGHLCCLGVAAQIFEHDPVGNQANTGDAGDWLVTDLGFENGKPEVQPDWWGPFAYANDSDGWTFDQIADWLETAINLQRTIDLLKALPDERFDMGRWRPIRDGGYISDDVLMHDCGTTACIAGWAAVFHPGHNSPRFRATLALGLSHYQADNLFIPASVSTKTREDAIRVLEQFRDTGVIQW